jgi:hypothetical protein
MRWLLVCYARSSEGKAASSWQNSRYQPTTPFVRLAALCPASAVGAFNPAPSLDEVAATKINVSKAIPKGAGSVGIPVGVDVTCQRSSASTEPRSRRQASRARSDSPWSSRAQTAPRSSPSASTRRPSAISLRSGTRPPPSHGRGAARRTSSPPCPTSAAWRPMSRPRPSLRASSWRATASPPQARDPAGAAARGAHDRVADAAAREAEERPRARPDQGPS